MDARLPAVLLLLAWVLPTATAQTPGSPEIIQLSAEFSEGSLLVGRPPPDDVALFSFTYSDVSVQQFNPTVSGTEAHTISATARWKGDQPADWAMSPPLLSVTQIFAGQSGTGELYVTHGPGTPVSNVEGIISITLTGSHTNQTHTVELPWRVVLRPSPAATIDRQDPAPEIVGPYERVTVLAKIRNVDTYPATYRLTARVLPGPGINPESIAFTGTGDYYLQGGEERIVAVEFMTPRDDWWYYSVSMVVQLGIRPVEGGAEITTTYVMTLDGFYFSENAILLLVAFVAQLLLLIFLLVYAKRVYDRRYLGRPIPPWEIPEERANLERLKREDPRAHYVVRYYLMEEEYRSALLWFYAYKKVGKKQLKAEARSVRLRERADEIQVETLPAERFEKLSERIQRRHAHRVERVQAWLLRKVEKSQRRLEANYEKDHRKDHQKWEAKVEKLKAKASKPYARERKKWEAQNQKVLAKWEKPWRKQKEKHGKALAKAQEAYVAKVKKADKPAYKAWKERREDWEVEANLSKKEGREPPPMPLPLSEKTGPPELPPPFVAPPRPDLPPEPKAPEVTGLPPEPTLSVPALATSHYAKHVLKAEKKAWKKIHKLEVKLGERLEKLSERRGETAQSLVRKRAKFLEAAESASTPGLVDRVLRRTPEQRERRHHLAYIKGLTKQRIKEAQEVEATRVERVRLDGELADADLEARIIREKTALHKALKVGTADQRTEEAAKVVALEKELAAGRVGHKRRLAEEAAASKKRLEARVAELKQQEREELARAAAKAGSAPAARPAES